MSDFQKLRALGLAELVTLIVALICLPLVALLLKHRGFKKTEKFLSGLGRPTRVDGSELKRVLQISRMISVAATRGPFKARCLVQAVTLWWILGLLGLASTIRLGLYKLGEAVEAHAWVLYGDEIVLGDIETLDEYTPLLDVNVNRG